MKIGLGERKLRRGRLRKGMMKIVLVLFPKLNTPFQKSEKFKVVVLTVLVTPRLRITKLLLLLFPNLVTAWLREKRRMNTLEGKERRREEIVLAKIVLALVLIVNKAGLLVVK